MWAFLFFQSDREKRGKIWIGLGYEVGTRQSRVKKGRFCTRINRYSYSRVHNAVIFTRDYF